MKYAVKTRFTDNGKVSSVVFGCDDDLQPSSKCGAAYDEYIDVFDTKEQAEQFKEEAYNA